MMGARRAWVWFFSGRYRNADDSNLVSGDYQTRGQRTSMLYYTAYLNSPIFNSYAIGSLFLPYHLNMLDGRHSRG